MQVINVNLIKRPGNWIKIFLMVLIGFFLIHQVLKLWGTSQSAQ